LLSGKFSKTGAPKSNFGVVDVRDLAKAHIQAMRLKKAKGKRFVLSSRVAHTAMELSQMLIQYFSAGLKQKQLLFIMPRMPMLVQGQQSALADENQVFKNTYDHTRAVHFLGYEQTHTLITAGEMAERFFDLGIVPLLSEKDDELSGLHISDEL
jgi:nucleoside-diphosphate-sugar epimerase